MEHRTPTEETTCAAEGCAEGFPPGTAWLYHYRLNVFVHQACVWNGQRLVCGEDISTHAVAMGIMPGSAGAEGGSHGI